MTARSLARRRLNRLTAKLSRVRDEAGLPELEARLEALHHERGRKSTEGGARFEDVAAAVVRTHVVPRLATEVGIRADADAADGLNRPRTNDGGAIRILRGVTLGAAGTEIDQLVVLVPRADDAPVDVLALVEAKRDVNDVAHGFRQRQMNLAWLTGDTAAYDADAFRTRAFPTGHFDRAGVHEQSGQRFIIDRTSFRRFARDARTGWFIDRLWFVTRAGMLWGAGRAAMSRLAYRASTDDAFNAGDDVYLDALRRWFTGMTDRVETPDVLRTYAADERWAGQVLLVGD